MSTVFYYCEHCGNVVIKLHDGGPVPTCCGDVMTRLNANLIDSKGEVSEKHLPVIECLDDCTIKVKIGSLPHPMTDIHHIDFIFLETENGGQMIKLNPDDKKAEAIFCTCKDKPTAAYAYCNIHGLWKLPIKGQPSKRRCCCNSESSC